MSARRQAGVVDVDNIVDGLRLGRLQAAELDLRRVSRDEHENEVKRGRVAHVEEYIEKVRGLKSLGGNLQRAELFKLAAWDAGWERDVAILRERHEEVMMARQQQQRLVAQTKLEEAQRQQVGVARQRGWWPLFS